MQPIPRGKVMVGGGGGVTAIQNQYDRISQPSQVMEFIQCLYYNVSRLLTYWQLHGFRYLSHPVLTRKIRINRETIYKQ